jgi:hypothetical protein
MESLIGLRMRAHSYTSELMRIAYTLPIEVEYCVWKVPVRTIGEFFVDTFVNDLEDVEIQANSATDGITATNIAPTPISSQGNKSHTPLQTRDRTWAGEYGQAGAEASVISNRAYAPYVSHAIWHIARTCYELEVSAFGGGAPTRVGAATGSVARTSVDLHQNAPIVGRLVRSATISMMGAGLANTPDNAISTTSLSEWAERLSVVDNPNRSYYEYLKAFGVNPAKIPGMPEPVLMQRRTLRPQGTPMTYWTPQTFAAPPSPPALFGTQSQVERATLDSAATSPNGYALIDGNGYQMFGAAIDETRGKRLMCDEPSLLVGTICWWPYDFDLKANSHIMDAIYMINSGTWGDPSKGSPDERDFLITRDVKAQRANGNFFNENDQTFVSAVNEDSQTGPFAINMLNLYLNGDTYSNAPILFGHHRQIGSPTPAGDESPIGAPLGGSADTSLRVHTLGDVRFGVATDLVA